MDIQVKYLDPTMEPIEQAHPGEWVDLRLADDVSMKAGDFLYLNLGVCIKVPAGHEAIMAPRSSTFKNFGIIQTNGIGVIDETYCGNDDIWRMPALAMRDTEIPKGSRLAQFRIQPIQGHVRVVPTEDMGGKSRGGLGSTGIK